MIQFNQVSKVYKNDTEAVRDFNLHITEGEFVTLIGPSGCGKTTTMKMINRLIEHTSRSIYIDKRNLKKKNIHKFYKNDTEYVLEFKLKITEREFVTLIGPSGCGKTTTMKMINRLIEPTSGSIYIDKRNIKKYNIHELRWNIGYVLQEIALFPHL